MFYTLYYIFLIAIRLRIFFTSNCILAKSTFLQAKSTLLNRNLDDDSRATLLDKVIVLTLHGGPIICKGDHVGVQQIVGA